MLNIIEIYYNLTLFRYYMTNIQNDLSLLYQAILNQDLEKIRSILKVNPELALNKNDCDQTLAHVAIINGKIESFEILLEFCPDLALEKDWIGQTVAVKTINNSNIAGLKIIFQYSPDSILEKDEYGQTLVHRAASYNKLEILKCLLEFCPELIRLQDQKGYTLLHKAAQQENSEIVNLLLRYDPSLADQTNDNQQKAIDLVYTPTTLSDEEFHERAINNQTIVEQLNDASNINRVMSLESSDSNNAESIEIKHIEFLIPIVRKMFIEQQPLAADGTIKKCKSKEQIFNKIHARITLTDEQLSKLSIAFDDTRSQFIDDNGFPTLKYLAAISPLTKVISAELETKKESIKNMMSSFKYVSPLVSTVKTAANKIKDFNQQQKIEKLAQLQAEMINIAIDSIKDFIVELANSHQSVFDQIAKNHPSCEPIFDVIKNIVSQQQIQNANVIEANSYIQNEEQITADTVIGATNPDMDMLY
ncbi:MAG: hypothetical protein EOP33_02310 [Rickettsiaceae bacterium]|nr:MAG: hypothetical protein EOP33_02310 [Rickettsiaceae bacterium]